MAAQSGLQAHRVGRRPKADCRGERGALKETRVYLYKIGDEVFHPLIIGCMLRESGKGYPQLRLTNQGISLGFQPDVTSRSQSALSAHHDPIPSMPPPGGGAERRNSLGFLGDPSLFDAFILRYICLTTIR